MSKYQIHNISTLGTFPHIELSVHLIISEGDHHILRLKYDPETRSILSKVDENDWELIGTVPEHANEGEYFSIVMWRLLSHGPLTSRHISPDALRMKDIVDSAPIPETQLKYPLNPSLMGDLLETATEGSELNLNEEAYSPEKRALIARLMEAMGMGEGYTTMRSTV